MYNRSLLLLLALLCAVACFGQEEKTETPAFDVSYAAKWNPLSLYFGKASIGGELNYKNRRSWTSVVGIPMDKTINFEMDNEEREVTLKTFSLMGGYRMYLGKKTMTGFYIEPYVKYVKNDATVPNIKATIGTQPTTFLLTSSYEGIGAGAQLGAQFMLGKRIVFDMFLLGPEANSASHQLLMRDVSNPPTGPWDQAAAADAQRELEDLVKDLPIIGDKVEVKVDAAKKEVTSDYKGFLPGFRAGFSIGIRI